VSGTAKQHVALDYAQRLAAGVAAAAPMVAQAVAQLAARRGVPAAVAGAAWQRCPRAHNETACPAAAAASDPSAAGAAVRLSSSRLSCFVCTAGLPFSFPLFFCCCMCNHAHPPTPFVFSRAVFSNF
jgi:hypothetical protein